MPGTAGRIDQPHFPIAKLAQGRFQGAVQNELLHKLRRLQQGIPLLRRLRQILVKIAQEPGIPIGIGEIMDQPPGIGIDLLPKPQQSHGPIARHRQPPQRVMALVEQRRHAGQMLHFPETGQEIFPVALPRMGTEITLVPVQGQSPPLGLGSGEIRLVHQTVVLQKPHEHPHQQPMHGGLGNHLLLEIMQGLGGPGSLPRRLPLGGQRCLKRRRGLDAFADIGFEEGRQAFQIAKQGGSIDHDKFLALTERGGKPNGAIG